MQDNIKPCYQLVAVSRVTVGDISKIPTLCVRDKQIYSDLISTNRRKPDFLKEVETKLDEQGTPQPILGFDLHIDLLELHE